MGRMVKSLTLTPQGEGPTARGRMVKGLKFG
jgi:hypothetical protein